MKKLVIILGLLLFYGQFTLADELTIKIDVAQGETPVKILGADIYANIDNKLTEITVSPDNIPFKWNFKAGALRIKSFWATKNQFNEVENDG